MLNHVLCVHVVQAVSVSAKAAEDNSNSLAGVSACIESNSLGHVCCVRQWSCRHVFILSVRDQSFCDFGAGEKDAELLEGFECSGDTLHWRLYQSGWDHDANAAHLASSFSTFVGVGREEIGPSPTASLLDKYYLAPASFAGGIWLSLFVGVASNQDAWPNAYFLDPGVCGHARRHESSRHRRLDAPGVVTKSALHPPLPKSLQ